MSKDITLLQNERRDILSGALSLSAGTCNTKHFAIRIKIFNLFNQAKATLS